MSRPLALTVLLLFLVAAPGVLAITIAEMSLEELFEEADHAVIAIQKSSRIVEKEPFVIREYTLEVERSLKGGSGSGTVLTVLQDTGYGGPSYKNGQPFLAFIATDAKSDQYYILNSIQGLWPLDESYAPTWWGSEYSLEEIEQAAAMYADTTAGNGQETTVQDQDDTPAPLSRAWPIAIAALVLIIAVIIVWSRKKEVSVKK